MAKNFYNLPPSWNPGYAIPDSVMDEGLERRAFVTKQLPRGTYDATRVGAAGYAIPSYVMEERTGRGTFTTKWLPRGYYGPKVPNWLDDAFSKLVGKQTLPDGATAMTVATLAGLGDSSPVAPGPFDRYGAKSAKKILGALRRYPQGSQPAVLKTMLETICPGLYGKVMSAADEAIRSGIPKEKALEVALASAMRSGILSELSETGRSRSAPQPRSLLGLGAYGPQQALGATPPPGFTWSTEGGTGHWARLRVGQTPVNSPDTLPPPVIMEVDHRTETRQDTMYAPPPVGTSMIQVGPFLMENKIGAKLRVFGTMLTPEVKAAVAEAINKRGLQISGGKKLFPTYKENVLSRMFPGWTGKTPSSGADNPENDLFMHPMFVFTDPTTGKRNGLKIGDLGSPGNEGFSVTYVETGNWLTGVLGYIVELGAKIVDVVKAVATAVADLACDALSDPSAVAAAAASTGGTAGIGVAVAAPLLCGGPKQPPPMIMPQQSSFLLPLAIGGGALVLLAILKKKSKP